MKSSWKQIISPTKLTYAPSLQISENALEYRSSHEQTTDERLVRRRQAWRGDVSVTHTDASCSVTGRWLDDAWSTTDARPLSAGQQTLLTAPPLKWPAPAPSPSPLPVRFPFHATVPSLSRRQAHSCNSHCSTNVVRASSASINYGISGSSSPRIRMQRTNHWNKPAKTNLFGLE